MAVDFKIIYNYTDIDDLASREQVVTYDTVPGNIIIISTISMPKAQDSSFLGWSIIDVTGAALLSNANITLTKDNILVFDISNLSLVNGNTYTITIDCKTKWVPVVTISCCLGCFDPVEDDTTTVSTIVELGKAVTETMKMGEK